MPAELIDDAQEWLNLRGAPLTTKNLNAAQAHLAENPDQRPSYAAQYESGEYTKPETTAEAPELDSMMERVMRDSARPSKQAAAPVLPGNKPSVPSTDEAPTPTHEDTNYEEQPTADPTATNADDPSATVSPVDDAAAEAEGAKSQLDDIGGSNDVAESAPTMPDNATGSSAGPKPAKRSAAADSIDYLKNLIGYTDDMNTRGGISDVMRGAKNAPAQTPSEPSDGPDIGAAITNAVGTAGAAGAVSIAAQLKNAMDSGMEDKAIRQHFSKNIGSRVANATRGSSDSGVLPKGVRPELQPHQLSALDGAIRAIREGNMPAADKWLTFLSPEDQTALKSTLSGAPAAAARPPTGAQRVMTSDPVQSLVGALSKAFTRGR